LRIVVIWAVGQEIRLPWGDQAARGSMLTVSTGTMRGVLTFILILVGAGCFAYWLLFMSWSHSYAAPSFQLQQTLVLSAGGACVLAGLILGVMTLVRRPAEGRDA